MQYFLILAALSLFLMIAFCSPSRGEPIEKKIFFKSPAFFYKIQELVEVYDKGDRVLPKIRKYNLNFDKRRMAYRDLSEIDTLIIHHTAISEDVSAARIDEEHKKIGWACIGYHYLIHKNGSIEKCRKNNMIGAHCQGYNSTSIGIALGGNFEKEKPTEEQLEALKGLIAALCVAYPNIKAVQGHCHYLATACPGCELNKLCEQLGIYK